MYILINYSRQVYSNRFKFQQVSFEASTTNYQIDGGIALDEMVLADFPCSSFGSCDFENAYCTWKNEETDDDTDWQLIQGVAPSSTTGPDADHTYGTVDGKSNGNGFCLGKRFERTMKVLC